MAKRIDAYLKSIQDVFLDIPGTVSDKNGIFIVPEYQRAYSWRSGEQCEKLWQDLEDFIGRRGKYETYFFGSVIINHDGEELLVIDGQQRLTTFMLLLKALLLRINDILGALPGDEDARYIKNHLEDRRREIMHCLYSFEDDDDFLKVIMGRKELPDLGIKYENRSIIEEYPDEMKKVLHGKSIAGIEGKVEDIKYKQKDNRRTNFYRNFWFFAEKVRPFESTQVNSFAKALLQSCQVIVVISHKTEEAIEIFNSLNSTGLPLADADIISAKLYKNCGADRSAYKDRWKGIVAATSSLAAQKISSIDEVLNQYMYILRAENAEQGTTLPGVRRYFTDINREPLKDPMGFIEKIEKIVSIWQDEESTAELATLKQLLLRHNNNFKFFYAAYFYFNGDETAENKQAFVEALLKLFAILSIQEIGYSSAAFKTFLFSLNVDMGKGAPTERIVGRIEEHIKAKFAREKIRGALVERDPENAVVYLNEYLFARERGRPFGLDSLKIEIEHIMPASGRNIPVIREDAKMSEDEFETYKDKLGNKILLEKPINGAIGRDWFITKQRSYRGSGFPIAKSLADYPGGAWGKDEIDAASKKAADRIAAYIFG